MRFCILLTIIVLGAMSAHAQEPACMYRSKAYSVGFSGCFQHVILECTDHNSWVQRGSCGANGIPDGLEVDGLPDSFDGQLCNAGGYYSPEGEGCIGGRYQQCQTSGQWAERSPVDGAACP